jgi:hypothetical protein
MTSTWLNRRQPVETRSEEHAQQYRFGLIVSVVRGRDPARSDSFALVFQVAVPLSPRCGLEPVVAAAGAADFPALDVTANPQSGGSLGGCCRSIGRPGIETVIQVGCFELDPQPRGEFVEAPEQGGRVEAA